MKNWFLSPLLSLAVIFCLYNTASAQNIQAEAKLQQYTIRIGDQTKFFITVHQPAKAHVDFPAFADTIISKVQVVSSNKADTVFDNNNHDAATITKSYTITSFDAGTYNIPSFTVGGAKTGSLILQVETVKVDTIKGIYDIKQPMKVSYTFIDWLRDNWYWVVGPILLIALIVGIIIYLRKRPKKEVIVKVVEPVIPPHVIAINNLKALRDKKLWQQDQVKEYYIELTDILREYLEKRYGITALEQTTDEIFASLRHLDIAENNRAELKKTLVLADLVKFAKERPLPTDNERAMDDALLFVSATQAVQPIVNREGDKGNV